MNFKEKPGIEFEPWMMELGFEDQSWRNDQVARAEIQVSGPHDKDNSEGIFLVLQVAEAQAVDREDLEFARYAVLLEERGPRVDVSVQLGATDDAHRVRALVEAFLLLQGGG